MAKKDRDNSGVHTDPDALAKLDNLLAAPEFQGWEEENLSLPPYWVTDIGKQFAARVIDLDNGDPEFPRYVLEALAPVDCQSGKREEAEDVHVKIGEFFTCSTYAGLPLARYIGCRVVVKCTGTRKVNQPKPIVRLQAWSCTPRTRRWSCRTARRSPSRSWQRSASLGRTLAPSRRAASPARRAPSKGRTPETARTLLP